MNSKRVVYEVFERGEGAWIPMHVESDSKDEEYFLGDVVGIGAKIREWRRYNSIGGPFRRFENESLTDWCSRVYCDSYPWPSTDDVVNEAVTTFLAEARRYSSEKFIICKILGPTETAEAFFAPPQSSRARELGQIYHRFDFALYLKLRYSEATKIYDRIASYILELVKACAELDIVDAVRIADDVCWYGGTLYNWDFVRDKYLYWHRLFANAIKRRGKYAILHTDGDITRNNLVRELASIYDALHPLDLCPKSTVDAAYRWVGRIIEVRKLLSDLSKRTVFFTGLPIDLIFNDSIVVSELTKLVEYFLKMHGKRDLVIATTHRPYPGRSYSEDLPRKKVQAVRELLRAYSL
ncbi:MAG: hypothetical protein DRJ40_02285 [Thermoprotei archaeon]|nr:MAG: hypothetical protein DRJ40_02285 [Thermoprotei archaeon]